MRYVKVKVVCFDEQVGKNVNKTFFVDAESFADAEKKFMKQFILSCHIR